MNIRPRIIPKFQNGGVPLWYLDRYGNRTSLIGWDLNKRYNYANQNLNTNDHRNAGNLDTVYSKNVAYTGTPGAISTDIQAFYNSDGKGLSAVDFVKLYNENAAKIRSHWALDLTYNTKSTNTRDHNRLFRKMFLSRSNQDLSPGSGYNIGYQDNIDDIEGSSTWLRRMDLYENEFDINNPDSDRMHELTLSDGSKAIVYKKANGDIGLYEKNGGNSLENKDTPQKKVNEVPVGEYKLPESIWTKLGQGLNKVAPDLLDALRLAGNMYNNDRVYKESMKAIRPNLQQSYHTYRQVVGDEATKQGFYRRAAQGEQKAARPITSDLDKQIAYQNEAKRIGDELRAQGDLADNLRIRETSQESMAHADANTERDTTLANSNLTELLKADAAKHQLTAQKYSADWTNLEQFLLGKQYLLEKEKAKQENILDLIKSIQMLEDLANDSDIKSAYDALNNKAKQLFPNGNVDWNDSRLADDIKNLQSVKRKAMIKYYTLYAKEGTKITKKHKDTSDKFLYKTSRDIVEHFRKMSKMTDDSRIKTLPKPIKLPSHPKKMLLGGVAPFTVYRPLGAGGENTVSTQTTSSTDSKSSKDTAAKDKLDMIKELFKQVLGLPIDVSRVYQEISGVLNKAKAFGEELSTDDLASMYLNVMNRMSQLKYSLEAYKQAHALAVSNEALNEIAVGSRGELILQNMETGEIKRGTYSEWVNSDKKLNPLTNSLLLEMRAKSPNLLFDDDVFNIVNNGVGLPKIAKEIKSLAATLGSYDKKIEGISEVQSNRIKAGLQTLSGFSGTPDGLYKITLDTKDSSANVKAALNYIYEMLPTNYKTILKMHSGSEENSLKLIAQYLMSQTNNYYKEDIDPITGQAAKGNKSGSGGEGSDMTPAMALSMGLGERETFVISDKTADGLKVSAVNLPLLDANHKPVAIATLQQIGSGDYAGQLQLNSATMGGVKISPEGINNVLVSEGRIHAAELPIDKNAAAQGIIKPDLNFLKNVEKADEQIRAAGITSRDNLSIDLVKLINDIYNKNNLPMIYSMSSKGPVLTSDYRRFAMVHATATEDAFEEDLSFNDGAIEASDDDRTRYETLMKQVSGNAKYSLNNGISIPVIGRVTGTDLYKGIVYIPMTESHISALASTGFKASPEEYNLIDALDLQALFIRSSGFTSAGSFTK